MTKARATPPQATQRTRWKRVLLAVTLALGLLVLALLDYALAARNLGLALAVGAVLGLLILLSLRLFLQSRRLPDLTAAAIQEDALSSRATATILVGLTLLAAALRFYRLGLHSLWYDETWTALAASPSVDAILRAPNPVPHLVVHLSLWLGRSEFVLRLGAAFAGILLIPAAYRLGRILYGRVEGLVAAGYLTLSVYALYRSQELRFYAWQMLFSTLGLYFLLRALQGRRWRDWAAFALATVLNLFTHPSALFLLAGQALYALAILLPELLHALRRRPAGTPGRRLSASLRLLVPLAAGALVALLAIGRAGRLVASLLQSPHWTLAPELVAAGDPGFTWAASPLSGWTYSLPSLLWVLQHPALMGVMFALVFLGWLSSSRRNVALVLLCYVVPPLALALVPIRFYYRYLSYLLPLLTLVLAHGIVTLSATVRPRPTGRGAIVALLTFLVALPNVVQLPEYYRGVEQEPWREMIAFVEAQRQPGDLVLIVLDYVVPAPRQPFDWYRTVPDDELPWQFFPEDGLLQDPAQLQGLPAVARGHPRIWLLLYSPDLDLAPPAVASLAAGFRLLHQQPFYDFQVLLFESRS